MKKPLLFIGLAVVAGVIFVQSRPTNVFTLFNPRIAEASINFLICATATLHSFRLERIHL